MTSKLYLLTIVLTGLVAVNVFFVLSSPKHQGGLADLDNQIFNSTQAYVLPISEPSYIPILDSNLSRPEVDAKSGIIYDSRSGRVLYEKNTRAKLPIASLTKILSAIVILENIDPKETVTIPQEAIKVDTEKQSLYLGEQISVENLLKLMLIESSNDAAYALAYYANSKGINFVNKMNEKAQQLGMNDSHFLDPAGLNDDAYSTADDLIKLVKESLQYDTIWNFLTEKNIIVRSSDGKIEHKIENTNQLLGVIPDIVGGKTGFTDGAQGCLILVVEIPGKNDRIISIILNSHDRFGDTKKLIDWVKAAYRWD